jgi:hypothetical protein
MKTEFECSQCKKHIIHESTISTGYGRNDRDEKVCFECCGINDGNQLKNLPIGGKMALYYSKGYVTNWPSTLKISAPYATKGQHNMAGTRTDVDFYYRGNKYHGTQYGQMNEILRIKRVKN